MMQLNIRVSRHSAFYSPLIAAVAGGFLEEEGFEPSYSIATPETTVPQGLKDGAVHVGQLAVSASWGLLEQGQTPHFMHFAQINECDGFFLLARDQEADFSWRGLAGREVLVDHLGQPLAMFKFACARKGIDTADIKIIDAGEPDEMDAAFRQGLGEYIHQQGPAPQQLQKDGFGRVVAALGDVSGPLAFSSLVATPAWLQSDGAKAFMRAYRRSRQYVINAPAADVAAMEQSFFPGIALDVLVDAIKRYQKLGCWTPEVEITHQSYAAALRVFAATGGISSDHPYRAVVVDPPQG